MVAAIQASAKGINMSGTIKQHWLLLKLGAMTKIPAVRRWRL